MSFDTLITHMAAAAARGDGHAVRACFTADGVYHDCFYGSFAGDAIIDLVENYFHRDAGDFRWDIHAPVSDGRLGYARYVFSYASKLPETRGQRAGFEGVAICELKDGKLASYREVANALMGLHALGFPPERVAKIARRESDAFFARDEMRAHRPVANAN